MMKLSETRTPLLESQSAAGEPIEHRGWKLVPISRSLRINLPGVHGGLIWNRPTAVVAYQPDGTQQVHQVKDLTRALQVATLGAGLGIAAWLWLVGRRRAADNG